MKRYEPCELCWKTLASSDGICLAKGISKKNNKDKCV